MKTTFLKLTCGNVSIVPSLRTSKLKKKKDAILWDSEENRVASCKRKICGKDNEVETALFTSFVDARARGAPITSNVLEAKARSLFYPVG